MRFITLLICFYCFVQPAFAVVDIALRGRDSVRVEDVYQHNGIPFIAVEDALDAVGLTGHWNSINHTFRIKSSRGWAEISPASGYMKVADEFYPLKDKPRFIDGRLRVTDSFILNQLAMLTGRSIYFNNLNPDTDSAPTKEASGLERFFSFLLNKKISKSGPLIRSIAIDPGHGGLDSGVISASGYKEKQLNLELAEKLSKKLKMQLGVPIYLSRDGDYEITMEQRLKSASREDVDLWLLLHAQSSFSPEISGVTLFVRPDENLLKAAGKEAEEPVLSESRQLAQELSLSLKENGIDVRGVFPSSRLSLGRGNLPTVQIELGFLSNLEELDKLQSADYQNQVIEALYAGIKRFATLTKEK
jgi:N-acetylmuramoyl-L-alanine amidase